ncbi:contact-dependent growth inhibition system immunity protein [Virgisporangium aurantiacum]|uniref:contact-dependent growth inhibition system immunity protein n=1 Tax=Virgisporangium aurantiacum TaxID=175570 RepID=UPI00194F20E3|nr:contact-dependent growth inhibition system immunity protein [Virgisporangium aurantiacum]
MEWVTRRPTARLWFDAVRHCDAREAVPILLPLAVDMLVDNPLAEGDFYPGDLLVTVLGLPSSTWVTLPGNRWRLTASSATYVGLNSWNASSAHRLRTGSVQASRNARAAAATC